MFIHKHEYYVHSRFGLFYSSSIKMNCLKSLGPLRINFLLLLFFFDFKIKKNNVTFFSGDLKLHKGDVALLKEEYNSTSCVRSWLSGIDLLIFSWLFIARSE